MKIIISQSQWDKMGTNREPTEKQLDLCYRILEKIGECDADEDGQPLFELSFENADAFIKENKGALVGSNSSFGPIPRDTELSAGDWGGIPNH